ncbi:hypothetical protein K438DRAFT_1991066 [Mycena galopus ATCC 62051]|nr:hypothetical protein K438DRAFT_1991066 [Mycena galopus ATCC 62051]
MASLGHGKGGRAEGRKAMASASRENQAIPDVKVSKGMDHRACEQYPHSDLNRESSQPQLDSGTRDLRPAMCTFAVVWPTRCAGQGKTCTRGRLVFISLDIVPPARLCVMPTRAADGCTPLLWRLAMDGVSLPFTRRFICWRSAAARLDWDMTKRAPGEQSAHLGPTFRSVSAPSSRTKVGVYVSIPLIPPSCFPPSFSHHAFFSSFPPSPSFALALPSSRPAFVASQCRDVRIYVRVGMGQALGFVPHYPLPDIALLLSQERQLRVGLAREAQAPCGMQIRAHPNPNVVRNTDPSIACRLSRDLVFSTCRFRQPAPSMCRCTHGTAHAGAGYPASRQRLLPSAASSASVSASRPMRAVLRHLPHTALLFDQQQQCQLLPDFAWAESPYSLPSVQTVSGGGGGGTVSIRPHPLCLHPRGSTACSSLPRAPAPAPALAVANRLIFVAASTHLVMRFARTAPGPRRSPMPLQRHHALGPSQVQLHLYARSLAVLHVGPSVLASIALSSLGLSFRRPRPPLRPRLGYERYLPASAAAPPRSALVLIVTTHPSTYVLIFGHEYRSLPNDRHHPHCGVRVVLCPSSSFRIPLYCWRHRLSAWHLVPRRIQIDPTDSPNAARATCPQMPPRPAKASTTPSAPPFPVSALAAHTIAILPEILTPTYIYH